MTKRKTLALLGVAAALSLAATGCGNRSGDNGATTSPTTAAFAVDASKCPTEATTAVADGQPLKIGTTLPLSGAAAAIGSAFSAGEQAYIGKVNAAGGVAGHQIQLVTKDDGYDPTKTVPAFTALVEQEKVLATVGQIGTANVAGTQPLAERTCTPQLWIGTGGPQFGDPVKHPWTTLGFASYAVEGSAWATYIAAKKPAAKVAYIALDNDSGEAYANAFKAAADKLGLKIVAAEKHPTTATNVDTQVTAMLAASPDYVIAMTAGTPCTLISTGLARGNFHGGVIAAANCGSLNYLNAVGAGADGQLTISFTGRDPANPAEVDNADIVQFKADMAKYSPTLPAPLLSQAINGYRFGAMLTDTLTAAAKLPGGLTRVNVMNAAWHMDTKVFATYGGVGKTNGTADAYLVEYGAWLKYDFSKKALVPAGDVIDAEGKTAA